MPDIIVVGDVNVDALFTIPAYPLPGTEAVATSVQMHTGGSAVNTAIALAKMDMDVGFIGRVGQDLLSHQAINDLKNAGVDCSQIQIDPKVGTGLVLITVTEDGERTMFSSRGANAYTRAGDIDPNYFLNCRWIHLSSYSFLAYHQYQTILTILELAENLPYTRVSLDIGTEPAMRARSQILEVLSRLEVITPNELEVTLLGEGRSLNTSLDYLVNGSGAHAIAATRGQEGCLLAIGDKRVHLPAFEVNMKDTTGAGDNFNAGLVLGRLVGLSWEASVALGNAIGALSTTHYGAGATALNRNDVFKLVERHLFKEEWGSVQYALEELTAWFEGLL